MGVQHRTGSVRAGRQCGATLQPRSTTSQRTQQPFGGGRVRGVCRQRFRPVTVTSNVRGCVRDRWGEGHRAAPPGSRPPWGEGANVCVVCPPRVTFHVRQLLVSRRGGMLSPVTMFNVRKGECPSFFTNAARAGSFVPPLEPSPTRNNARHQYYPVACLGPVVTRPAQNPKPLVISPGVTR